MSATLTWFSSGLGTKTGTTIAALITDMAALVNTKLADPNFSWQVASSSIAGNPHWLVLKPKSGAPGRILYIIWTVSPAGNNSAILDLTPTTLNLYACYFPNGNTDTPSNLLAASGTIMGNDTNAVKVTFGVAVSTFYIASWVPFYFDCAEGVFFGFSNPAGGTTHSVGVGELLVDGADNAYGAVISFGSTNSNTFGSNTSVLPWVGTVQQAGAGNQALFRTNYGSPNRAYFMAWAPSAAWASQAVSSTDILTNTALNRVWFVPVQVLGQTKGEGFALKLRQIAFGPGVVMPFSQYQASGPVVRAICFNPLNIGGNGAPWFTNFKL